ncbi:hypothetical protein B0I35DRAFT_399133 [Stachybotrys elegans]|uniref:NmrA-like domain-containing protein n=1 Tax=Stachybotrys elegans TaxID=80388 RepID=A0A8K0SGK5_9HYPO|nr:hypothetical protein B0I35DRAFT_399133 [Stachybotrys elegans]
MVKIAIAAASSQLARTIIDKLVETKKHEIVAFVRKSPDEFPPLSGVTWVQTTYEDKAELVGLLQGVHTVLCFLAVHLDPRNANQKRLIDASVEAGVKRFAPSEWSTGEKLDASIDSIPWYAGKVEVSDYLKELNRDKKVIEFCRFQPGSFLEYLGHPRVKSKYLYTIPGLVNFEKIHALAMEGTEDDPVAYTSVEDIANIVVRAVDYEGEWPVNGGIRGSVATLKELLRIGEKVRGKPFELEWLKQSDVEAGIINTDNYLVVDLPSIPADQVTAFSKMATGKVLLSQHRGLWTPGDEWNRIFPDYKFVQIEDFLVKIFSDQA